MPVEVKTRESEHKNYVAAGADPRAADWLCSLTTRERHQSRVGAAREATTAWIDAENILDHRGDTTGRVMDSRAALRWLLCTEEAAGLYGGSLTDPGDATTRHPAFRGLGRGRRKATDGPAWTAAIAAAGKSQNQFHSWIDATGCNWCVYTRTSDYYNAETEDFFPVVSLDPVDFIRLFPEGGHIAVITRYVLATTDPQWRADAANFLIHCRVAVERAEEKVSVPTDASILAGEGDILVTLKDAEACSFCREGVESWLWEHGLCKDLIEVPASTLLRVAPGDDQIKRVVEAARRRIALTTR